MEKNEDNVENRQKNRIPNNIIKLIEIINKTLFKCINDNLNNIKIIEKKLLFVNNNIKIVFGKKGKSEINHKVYGSEKLLLKSYKLNSFASLEKPNHHKHFLKENNNNVNITNQNITIDMNTNNYLNFKLKKKLKRQHDNNKIKELEYLERIAILQCKLNLYERNLEKLILENNKYEIIKQRNKSLKSNDDICYFRNNSSELCKGKEKVYTRPYSSTMDAKINNLKNININNNNSIINSYISKKTNTLDSYFNKNKKRNCCKSLNDLHYKYQIGNNYFRNNFKEIKKTIRKNKNKMNKFINNCLKGIK